MVPLATFNLASSHVPGYSWFALFGTPQSRIAAGGIRALRYRLFELARAAQPDGRPPMTTAGIDLIAPPGSALAVRLPDVATPMFLLFSPGTPGAPWTTSGESPPYAGFSVIVDDQDAWNGGRADPAGRVRIALPLDPVKGVHELRILADAPARLTRLRDVEVVAESGDVVESPALRDSRLESAWRLHNAR
jgi:hypothetical protein